MAAKKAIRKKKKSSVARKVVIVALELVLLAVVLAGFYAVSKWNKIDHVDLDPDQVVVNPDLDQSYVEEIQKGYNTYAVFGIDGDRTNCDVILLVSINEDNGEIRMASVYRDTIMQMPKGTLEKVNQGINQNLDESKEAVNQGITQMNILNRNLDLDLDGFVMVDWTSVAVAINWMGGVDVEVTDAMMKEINSYITHTVECMTNDLGSFHLTSAGYQHLDGVQTVAYCRLRHQDSDLGRTKRQREVLAQLFAKAKQMSPRELAGIIDGVFPGIATTLSLGELIGLASRIGSYHLGPSTGFPFYTAFVEKWRPLCDYPLFAMNLENNVTQLHSFLYGTQEYEPSATLIGISNALQEETDSLGLAVPETTPFSTE